MIISHLMGGLGNQMFEYAAGLSLGMRRNTVLKLDISFFHDGNVDGRSYALDCLNVTAQFATMDEIWRLSGKLGRKQELAKKILSALGQRRLTDLLSVMGQAHYQEQWTFYPQFHELPDNTWLHGNYQSEKFFAPVADVLRQQFTFRYPPTSDVEAMAARIKSGPSVAVHIRRGDYANNEEFSRGIGVLPKDYYDNAMRVMQSKVGDKATFYLFSDDHESFDIAWPPGGRCVWVKCCGSANAHDAMRLMSLCDHNIVANSTFSWWGAWLNTNTDKTVIAPKQWFAGYRHDERDICPAEWLRI